MHLGMQLASWTVMRAARHGNLDWRKRRRFGETTRTVLLLSTPRGRQMLVVTTLGVPLYQSCTNRRKSVFLSGSCSGIRDILAACRHVSCPIRQHRTRNTVEDAAFCLGLPAGDVVDGATGVIVEAEGDHAHG